MAVRKLRHGCLLVLASVLWTGAFQPAVADDAAFVPPSPDTRAEPTTDVQKVYTLDELARLTQESNPILRRDLARIEELQGTALQAGLCPNPRLDFINPWQFAGTNSQYSGGLTQEFITGGKLRLNRAALNESVRQAQLAYDQNRIELLSHVRRQFYSVLASQERTRVLKQTREIVGQAEQTGDKLLKLGIGNKTDVLALEIETRRVDVALRNSIAVEETGKQQLAAYVGLPNLPIPKVEGRFYEKPPEFDADNVRQAILSRNSQIEIAKVEIARRQYLLERAQVDWYPDLTASVGYQFFDKAPKNEFLLYITGPIPIWNRNQGGIASAEAGVRESTESVGVVENSLLQPAAEALGRYQTALQQTDEYRQQILPKAKEAIELARDGYTKGEFDFPRYLSAQRTLVNAQIEYINVLDQLWAAATDIAQLMQVESFP